MMHGCSRHGAGRPRLLYCTVTALVVLILACSVGCARHRQPLRVPVQQVPHINHKERVPSLCPVNCPGARVTSRFGEKRSGGRLHKGIDIAVPCGTPVVASATGTTTYAGAQDGYGKIVVIDHCNGYETAYAHLDKIVTSRGAQVQRGARIGLAGATGNATGPHLHYEVRKGGGFVDPEPFLP